ILLCDAVGSSEFKKVLEENPKYKEVFENFTYCPDTLSGYPCTRDNIPLILGGQFNKNEKVFQEFSSETLNGSPFFKELNDSGYDINLYESELIWYGSRNYEIKNGEDFKDYKLPFGLFMREELKYVGYKYLPYLLKEHSRIETMNFNGLVEMYMWDDHTIFQNIKKTPEITKVPQKVFSYIHTEGAHLPFGYDRDLNIIENGTYKQKIEAMITMLNAYIERLKENNLYDNTVIVIMADHGNTALISADDMLVRANPMFMIKGINEHHSFTESQKPVSYGDLMDIYSALLEEQTAEEALSHIPDSRQRIYMWYRNFQLESHIVEYAVTGKAWEWEKFEKTGNVYDLY
ncbi:MAG: sulfatase-like hydrolase/transferase, partial [Ruminiclostridium sp.]|nr:sulfatase-like hydrolase/transferase [Ruminiclostridium sp.]